MKFEQHQKILFIGDSITDCGRRDTNAPFGKGYANLVRSLVTARYPYLGLRWENRGISGNTVRDLAERWQDDVISEQPDWLSVKIGINDVWRHFKGGTNAGIPIEEYEATYRMLLTQAVEATGCKLIIAEPYIIEADHSDPMRVRMDQFGAVARKLAVEFDAVQVHTQAAFDQALKTTSPSDWADDKVHPDLQGHGVIALAYLRAIGWDLGE